MIQNTEKHVLPILEKIFFVTAQNYRPMDEIRLFEMNCTISKNKEVYNSQPLRR